MLFPFWYILWGVKIVDYRKIIKFGNSSHVVSLPKTWLEKNNLKKGDSLFFEENENQDLVLSSKPKGKTEKKEILINADKKEVDRVIADVIAAYVNNYNIIKIKGKDLSNVNKEIKNVLNDFVAVEIVEESPNIIIAKDFLDINEFTQKDLIRKIDLTTRSMIEDSIKCVEKKKFENLTKRDKEVNKLTFLIYKISKNALKDPEILNKLGIKSVHLVTDWMAVSNIEKLADETKRISKFVKCKKLTDEQSKELSMIYKEMEKYFKDVMKAFYNKDKNLAHSIIANYRVLTKKCDDYFEKHYEPVIGNIVEKLKGIATRVRNIARIIVYHED